MIRIRFAGSAAVLLPVALVGAAGTSPPLPPPRAWLQYEVILWVGESAHSDPSRWPLFLQRLRELGATAGMVHGRAAPDPWVAAGVRYYVENVVNRGLCLKWNSSVRDWNAFINRWMATRDPAAFVREYGLYDPEWRAWARREARESARRHAPHSPLAYNLRDELSITISANPFDYDWSGPTLEAFRAWLRNRYTDLDALNRAWATRFPDWSAVRPFSTDEIKHRMVSGADHPQGAPDWSALARVVFRAEEARRTPRRWNFAPWCEFRTFLDQTWAELLDELRREMRAVDPLTPVGIEGTQMPHAFGGFDLERLARAVDWAEPYDIGAARAIFGSFMEDRPLLSTIGEADEATARRRLWRLLLEGDRGCILWWSEDCLQWDAPDLPLTPKGRALAAAVRPLRGPLTELWLRATPEWDPIAIHYSQPSIQVNWLLESTVDGRTWPRRFSSYEAQHNRQAALRVRWLSALRAAGWSPRFLASSQIEAGELLRGRWRALVMPGSWAMSDRELAALREFTAAGGRLIYDGEPAAWDERGRLRETAAMPPQSSDPPPDPVAHLADLAPPLRVEGGGPVAVFRRRLDAVRLVGLSPETGATMGEDLTITERAAADATEVEVVFAQPLHAADLRTGRRFGRVDRLRLRLDPAEPPLLAVSDAPLPEASDLVGALLGPASGPR
ncbi:MAG: beta-galactosidase [Kiritimatiellae bacterium]|nr:beta-galactosidase [Kiritimatiellia bacterium]